MIRSSGRRLPQHVVHLLVPALPLSLVRVDVIVKDCEVAREKRLYVPHHQVKRLSTDFVESAAERPHHTEDEPLLEQRVVVVRLVRHVEVGSLAVASHKSIEQLGKSYYYRHLQRRHVLSELVLLVPLLVEQLHEPLLHQLLYRVLHWLLLYPRSQPALQVRTPTQVVQVQEHHTRTTHRSRRCHCQVLHLEHQTHLGRQIYSVSVEQSQHFVVVEHCVHRLNPEGIDRSIEDHPPLRLRLFFAESAHHGGKHSLMPLAIHVHEAKEFFEVDSFGVEHFVLDLRVLFIFLAEGVEGVLQDFPAGRLATHRSAHQHVAVPGVLAVVQLHYFLHLFSLGHESRLLHFGLDCVEESVVVHLLHFHVGEEIVEERVEQRNVLPHELGNVHVHDRLHQDQNLLRELLLLQFLYQLLVLLVDLVQLTLDIGLSPDGPGAGED